MSAAGIGSMTAAIDRGDIDEAARQGALAGPATVETALGSSARRAVLAGIAAAPSVEDRAELLPALAHVAAGADRRTALPAARAARGISRWLAAHELADDLAPADVDAWRAAFADLALARDHFVEVRVAALGAANALAHVSDPSALGFDAALLTDPDPLVAAEAQSLQ
jgi:hypothetical protein